MLSKFTVPVAQLSTPKSGDCLVDHWWFVDAEGGVLFYTGAGPLDQPHPMCNSDRGILEHGAFRATYKDFSIVQIKVAYLAHAVVANRAARERDKAVPKETA